MQINDSVGRNPTVKKQNYTGQKKIMLQNLQPFNPAAKLDKLAADKNRD